MPDSNKIPLFPLGVVLFPDIPLPLHIFEERYKLMVNKCLSNDSVFGITLHADDKLYNVGCTAKIISVLKKYEDGRMDILTQGVKRFAIENISEEKPYLEADVAFLSENLKGPINPDLKDGAIEFLKKIIESTGHEANIFDFEEMDSRQLSYIIAAYGGFTILEKQELLEFEETDDRLRKELELRDVVMRRLEFSKRLSDVGKSNGRLIN